MGSLRSFLVLLGNNVRTLDIINEDHHVLLRKRRIEDFGYHHLLCFE